jgi:peptidoglycan/xylan/chitin deacetylase (PgdA/CDA1 family)
MKVALTFDDGPTPGTSDAVLDLLGEMNVKAAFFVVGVNARQHPELLRRIHDEGHLIGNHTLDHSHYTVFGRLKYWKNQIRAADDVVESAVGIRPALFRPPMGVRTWHTARAARELGHTVVTWSRRGVDGFPTRSERIVKRLSSATGGEILLLHDGVEPHSPYRDRTATVAALRPLIDQLRLRGLTPVRLDELIGVPAYQSPVGVAAPASPPPPAAPAPAAAAT